MATFGDLYQAALDTELGSNDSAVLFTTARRKHAINEGYRQFADLTECLIKQSTISCTNGQQEFNLLDSTVFGSTDFLRVSDQAPIFQVSNSNGLQQTYAGESFPQREVQWLDAAQPGWRSTVTGLPSAWYLRREAGVIYIGLDRPVGLSTGSTQTAKLIVPYVPTPSSLTSDTAVPFNFANVARSDLRPYQQALVHYAAHDLEKIRTDPEASDRQLQKFLGYVQRYVQATRPKGPRSLRTSKSYFQDARKGREETGLRGPWWYR